MANNSKNQEKSVGAGAALGVAAAAAGAAAAAAGAYWLYGAKHATKHRKLAKSYILKARVEALEALEKVKDIDKTTYLALVDKIVAKYSATAGITAEEVAQITKDLKAGWSYVNSALVTAKGGKKVAKKSAKKAPAKKKYNRN